MQFDKYTYMAVCNMELSFQEIVNLRNSLIKLACLFCFVFVLCQFFSLFLFLWPYVFSQGFKYTRLKFWLFWMNRIVSDSGLGSYIEHKKLLQDHDFSKLKGANILACISYNGAIIHVRALIRINLWIYFMFWK